jgi:hypothetical protein
LLAGSSNQFVTVGTSMLPIAGHLQPQRAQLGGANVAFGALQAGGGHVSALPR